MGKMMTYFGLILLCHRNLTHFFGSSCQQLWWHDMVNLYRTLKNMSLPCCSLAVDLMFYIHKYIYIYINIHVYGTMCVYNMYIYISMYIYIYVYHVCLKRQLAVVWLVKSSFWQISFTHILELPCQLNPIYISFDQFRSCFFRFTGFHCC